MPEDRKATEVKVQVRFLGEPALLTRYGRPIGPLPKKAWALLAYLHLASPRMASRTEIATLLWPDSTEAAGRASLRTLLSVLKRPLAVAGLADLKSTKSSVGLSWPSGVVDLDRIEDAILDHSGGLCDALDLHYGGEFLARLGLRSGTFEEWLLVERQRQKQLITKALRACLDLAETPEQSIETAEQLLRFDPNAEDAYRALMEAHWVQGAAAQALGAFRRCEEALQRDLDTIPSFATRLLASDIRRKAKGQAAPAQAWRGKVVAIEARPVLIGERSAEVSPDALLEAQRGLATLFATRISQAGGGIVADGATRLLAVFDHGSEAQKLSSAFQCAKRMAEATVGVEDATSLQVVVVITGEEAIVLRGTDGQVTEVACAALVCMQAATLESAPGGIWVHRKLSVDLPEGASLSDGAGVFGRLI